MPDEVTGRFARCAAAVTLWLPKWWKRVAKPDAWGINSKSVSRPRPGQLRELVTLVTDDANTPFVPVLAEGVVEADITVAVFTRSVIALVFET